MSSLKLTSRERVLRTLRREPTDCVAVGPYMYDVAAHLAGVDLRDFRSDPQAMVEAQLTLYEQVQQDVIAVGADNFYIAEGLGCESTDDEGEMPSLGKPAVEALEAVYDVQVPDPHRDGRMPVMIEGIRLVREKLGDRVAVRSPGTGPFALASYLIGSQNWLTEIAMIEAGMEEANEQAVHHALGITSDALIAFGKACADAGADILHCGDSLASCDVISPRTYERFAHPYQQKVFAAWREHGHTGKLLHICGDSTKVLEQYASTGADIVEIDNNVDLARAKQTIGETVTLMGNVHTVTDLLDGSVEDVRAASQRCIDAAAAGGGFILGSGCIVPRATPIENLQEMVRVARGHAMGL